MIPRADEKQIAINLNSLLVVDLDGLAKSCDMNRTHFMLSIIMTWLSALGESNMPGLFYITSLLRVRENQMNGNHAYEHEFTESCIPEKTLPMKFTESTIHSINSFASVNHISRHLLLKTMVIVGIEELIELTDRKPFEFAEIEPALHKAFCNIMGKGFKAFKTFIK